MAGGHGPGGSSQQLDSRVLIYKELELLGAQDICKGKDTIWVWGWGKVELLEEDGDWVWFADTGLCREDCLPLARCCQKLVHPQGHILPERTGQQELLVQIFFPSLCFARADLICRQFQNVSPSDMHRLYSLQGAFTPLISLEPHSNPEN